MKRLQENDEITCNIRKIEGEREGEEKLHITQPVLEELKSSNILCLFYFHVCGTEQGTNSRQTKVCVLAASHCDGSTQTRSMDTKNR